MAQKPNTKYQCYPRGDGSDCRKFELDRLTSQGEYQGLRIEPRREEIKITDPQKRLEAMTTRIFSDKPGYRMRFNVQWLNDWYTHVLITTQDWQPYDDPTADQVDRDWS